ncbi:MAG: cytochrome P450 [Rhodospirillaceae bacterium]|jgi:cytochrome P450|nr:cytochrome P450 [Rhodospirillaceae bacterium]
MTSETKITELADLTIGSPDVQEHPYEYYKLMREQEPVHYDPHTDLWMVADYHLAVEVLKNWQVFSSQIDMRTDVGGPDLAESNALFAKDGYTVPDVLTQVDPPRHTFYRSLIDKAFTGPVVKRMDEYLVDHANELIDSFISKGQCDFKEEFAVPLPLGVIADQVGAPRSDIHRFRVWTDAFVETLGIMLSPERRLECTKLIIEYQHYFVDRINEKKANPQEDILSGLVAARHEDGQPLAYEELLAILQQLMTAGNETTRNHLVASMKLLIDEPDLQAILRNDAAMVKKFVEESLRLESPTQGLFRIANHDTELGGYNVPKGAKIYLAYGSANRDDKQFPNADKLDITRHNATKHLAFGYGIHRCIGQMLAKKELEIGISTLLQRLDNIALKPGHSPITHTPSFILRGIESLHITFDKIG